MKLFYHNAAVRYREDLRLKRNTSASRHTIPSVTGTAIQIPVSPAICARIHAAGMMSTNPLKMDTVNACLGRSAELKKDAATMLIPEKKRLTK